MGKIIVSHNVNGIKGLCVVKPDVFYDKRGHFIEAYNEKEFYKENFNIHFVQDNEVYNKKGVLRGFHINQKNPQAKLVRVLSGRIYDVAIDLRKDSNTYKRWYGIVLSSENKKQLYIPEGFAHGYLAMEETTILFKVTSHYIAGDESCFAWNSKMLNINWPEIGCDFLMNDMDRNSPDIMFTNI